MMSNFPSSSGSSSIAQGQTTITPTTNPRKRKRADELAAEYPLDLYAVPIPTPGRPESFTATLHCRYCSIAMTAREDFIKEHLSTVVHQTLKMEAIMKAEENLRSIAYANWGSYYAAAASAYAGISGGGGTGGGFDPSFYIEPASNTNKKQGNRGGGQKRGPKSQKLDQQQKASIASSTTTSATQSKPSTPLLTIGSGYNETTGFWESVSHSPPKPLPTYTITSSSPPSTSHSLMPPPSLYQKPGPSSSPSSGSTSTKNTATQPQKKRTTSPNNPPDKNVLHLKWRKYNANLSTMFNEFRLKGLFCDATVWCEGKTLKCHKVILSACSSYFEQLLQENQSHHPVVIMKNVSFEDAELLVEFMYNGQIYIPSDKLTKIVKVAESFRIKGLGVDDDDDANENYVGEGNLCIAEIKEVEEKASISPKPVDFEKNGVEGGAPTSLSATERLLSLLRKDAAANQASDVREKGTSCTAKTKF